MIPRSSYLLHYPFNLQTSTHTHIINYSSKIPKTKQKYQQKSILAGIVSSFESLLCSKEVEIETLQGKKKHTRELVLFAATVYAFLESTWLYSCICSISTMNSI
jgi:hypothetical protein